MADKQSHQDTWHSSSRLRRLGILLLFVVILQSMVVILTIGAWPSTVRGWAALLLLGPLVYLALEYLGEKLFSSRFGSKISKKKFSAARIGVALVLLVVLMAIVVMLGLLLESRFPPN